MNRNITDVNVAADAKAAVRFWEEHPEITIQETSITQIKRMLNAFQTVAEATMKAESQLRLQMTERDELGKALQQFASRIRSVARGTYGPDSKEYEQTGGTDVNPLIILGRS